DPGGPRTLRVGQVDTGLKPSEAGTRAGEGDHFAVDREVRPGPGECIDHLRERRRRIVPTARVQLRGAAAASGEAALTVELALVDPALGPEPVMAQGCQRRFGRGAHRGLLFAALPAGRVI